ncbi:MULTISPECIES: hypothetical protein [Megasphaera]|uniref:Uncharacterized protein n=1 Tax=Megasphaera vaginalis (ex Srinivasan et al. 2021) TaxID=1111454 RepID=U7UGF3_9FIRM|nr:MULTISPECIES: hypothetical protein [Megasphaera]ERT58391.1 hypothetical protein HMPREF1250_1053 [Megasphaera vaginalis (ex Srinivasan et al. 2021)]
MELYKLIDGYQARREDGAFMAAWFTSNMMSVHTKHPVPAKELVRPFLHEKTSGELRREREEFLKSFTRQREEAGLDGDRSEYLDPDRSE